MPVDYDPYAPLRQYQSVSGALRPPNWSEQFREIGRTEASSIDPRMVQMQSAPTNFGEGLLQGLASAFNQFGAMRQQQQLQQQQIQALGQLGVSQQDAQAMMNAGIDPKWMLERQQIQKAEQNRISAQHQWEEQQKQDQRTYEEKKRDRQNAEISRQADQYAQAVLHGKGEPQGLIPEAYRLGGERVRTLLQKRREFSKPKPQTPEQIHRANRMFDVANPMPRRGVGRSGVGNNKPIQMKDFRDSLGEIRKMKSDDQLDNATAHLQDEYAQGRGTPEQYHILNSQINAQRRTLHSKKSAVDKLLGP